MFDINQHYNRPYILWAIVVPNRLVGMGLKVYVHAWDTDQTVEDACRADSAVISLEATGDF